MQLNKSTTKIRTSQYRRRYERLPSIDSTRSFSPIDKIYTSSCDGIIIDHHIRSSNGIGSSDGVAVCRGHGSGDHRGLTYWWSDTGAKSFVTDVGLRMTDKFAATVAFCLHSPKKILINDPSLACTSISPRLLLCPRYVYIQLSDADIDGSVDEVQISGFNLKIKTRGAS